MTGTPKSSRIDYTSSENDNILVQGIAGNKNALGYVPYAYYEQNKYDEQKKQGKLKALAAGTALVRAGLS